MAHDSPRQHAGGQADLVQLDRDHPGFRDPVYRARRNDIARAALEYRGGQPPVIEYTEAEHAVWRQVLKALGPLHEQWAPRGYVILNRRLGLDRDRIPQLREVNVRLTAVTGFEMEPVAGLVSTRTFLRYLGDGIFLSTQYVRHPSSPLYTPEPDVIHELIGHAASFTHPMIAQLNRSFGKAAQVANEAEIEKLGRAYWWTMEFGGLMEDGRVKAFGSGLLSSCGEIARFATEAELRDFDLKRMVATDYDTSSYQPQIFVAPSWEILYYELDTWLESGAWREGSGR